MLDAIKTSLETAINKKDLQYVLIGNPLSISKQMAEKGVCIIRPIENQFKPVTTGIQVQDGKQFRLVFVKSVQDEFNNNAQKENATEWLMRIMEGRNSDGTLQVNTGMYIVLNNLRKWGILQTKIMTRYHTNEVRGIAGGITEGYIEVVQSDIFNQSI